PRVDRFFDSWVYDGTLVAASAACLARAAIVRDERRAWAIIGTGILLWTGGEIYWSLKLSGLETVPVPSPADAFYLCLYPACYIGLVLLVRERVATFSRSLWLDGAIAAGAVGALAAAVAFNPIVDATSGNALGVAT